MCIYTIVPINFPKDRLVSAQKEGDREREATYICKAKFISLMSSSCLVLFKVKKKEQAAAAAIKINDSTFICSLKGNRIDEI